MLSGVATGEVEDSPGLGALHLQYKAEKHTTRKRLRQQGSCSLSTSKLRPTKRHCSKQAAAQAAAAVATGIKSSKQKRPSCTRALLVDSGSSSSSSSSRSRSNVADRDESSDTSAGNRDSRGGEEKESVQCGTKLQRAEVMVHGGLQDEKKGSLRCIRAKAGREAAGKSTTGRVIRGKGGKGRRDGIGKETDQQVREEGGRKGSVMPFLCGTARAGAEVGQRRQQQVAWLDAEGCAINALEQELNGLQASIDTAALEVN